MPAKNTNKGKIRTLELKEAAGTGKNRWLRFEDTNYGSMVSASDENNFIDVALTERQLRSIQNWIEKRLNKDKGEQK